jgi:hypothetical protein
MDERFNISYNQAYPPVPRLFCFNSRLGLTQNIALFGLANQAPGVFGQQKTLA